MQHHGKIDIRDRPGAEEVVGAAAEQGESRREQSVGGLTGALRQFWPFGVAEDDKRRALVANRHEIAAHPGLNLACPRSIARVRREEAHAGKDLVEVFADGRRFRQCESVMN